MRVNVDSAVVMDPRIKRLGLYTSMDWHEALGRLLLVWFVCYEARSEAFASEDIDIAAEREGFAAAMVRAELADEEDGRIRVRGVRDRIDFLLRNQAKAKRGGVKSGKSRRIKEIDPEANASRDAKQTLQPNASDESKPDFGDGRSKDGTLLSVSGSCSGSQRESRPPLAPDESRIRAASQVWQEHEEMRARVASQLGVTAPRLLVNDDGRRQLGQRVGEMVQDGETLDSAIARCKHVLSRAEFEARKARNMDWLDGQLWRKDRFERLASRPLEKPIQVVDLTPPGGYSNPFLDGSIEPSIPDHVLRALDEQFKE